MPSWIKGARQLRACTWGEFEVYDISRALNTPVSKQKPISLGLGVALGLLYHLVQGGGGRQSSCELCVFKGCLWLQAPFVLAQNKWIVNINNVFELWLLCWNKLDMFHWWLALKGDLFAMFGTFSLKKDLHLKLNSSPLLNMFSTLQ